MKTIDFDAALSSAVLSVLSPWFCSYLHQAYTPQNGRHSPIRRRALAADEHSTVYFASQVLPIQLSEVCWHKGSSSVSAT
jgi:hypothetical protein